jgi:hypothetical protein
LYLINSILLACASTVVSICKYAASVGGGVGPSVDVIKGKRRKNPKKVNEDGKKK